MVAPTDLMGKTLQQLHRQLTVLLGPRVGVACTDVHGDPESLYPEEFSTIARAVPRRQREYAAGRSAARQAMVAMGWPAAAVRSAADRSPVWPAGVVGSIAHTHSACVAVVARQTDMATVGIDLEDNQPIEADLWPTICTPAELTFLLTQPAHRQGVLVKHLFAAKEAVYKCQFPLTQRMLDFQEVEVVFDPGCMPSRFQTVIDGLTAPMKMTGSFLQCGELIAACCCLPAGSDVASPSSLELAETEVIA